MAGSMHMNMLSHKDFPIRLLGAVHLKNRIIQRKAIHVDQVMDLHSEIGAYRLVEKGVEFDFTTTVMVQGETYWEEISTYFMAGRFGGKENPSDEKSFELNKLEETEDKASWHVPADRGRRYAKITGDYNPIHMSSLAAKLFGFKRDIAHGFGVVAQGIEQSDAIANDAAEIQLDVIFKGPVFLDSQVYLKQGVGEHQKSFDIYCGDNPKPSMCVAIKNL
jgi:acyl dehydratase